MDNNILIYFPSLILNVSPHVVHSYQFHYVYDSYNNETSFIFTNIYTFISLTCFEVFKHFHIYSAFIHFLKLI